MPLPHPSAASATVAAVVEMAVKATSPTAKAVILRI
jgi:hypothetical protein